MKFNMSEEIEIAKEEFKTRWGQAWRMEYARDHQLYKWSPKYCRNIFDLAQTPEPPWHLYHSPDFVGLQWGTGFAVLTTDAFSRFSAKSLSKLCKGGLNR